MSRIRVLSIFGTRPEAVKMAPVVHALQVEPGTESLVCVTAQHRQMLDQVTSLFNIIPDFDLDLMRDDQTLAEITASVITQLEPVLEDAQPEWILVQGDTTTVMAASLLAYYHHIKVGHVEAGLRTNDKWQPFPEEINRRIASVVADLHFAPTSWAKDNLIREGVPEKRIHVTGNTVIDALHTVAKIPYEFSSGPLKELPLDRRLILVTAHRRENFGQRLENICAALETIAQQYAGDVHLVYPVHLNPNVDLPVRERLGEVSNITLLPPIDYLPLVHLMRKSTLVLTDSGGIQEEAPGFGVPVLVLREVTERPEGVNAGTVCLVGTDKNTIISHVRQLLDDEKEYARMAQAVNPYGDGNASPRIVDAIIHYV